MSRKIFFFNEQVNFVLKNKGKIRWWISEVIRAEGEKRGIINFIFCNDIYLSGLNETYLKHTTLTDIITFPFTESGRNIAGDIYISIERVRENAILFNQLFEDEINRVIIHGILHLLGYKDKTKKEKLLMRTKEDYYLMTSPPAPPLQGEG